LVESAAVPLLGKVDGIVMISFWFTGFHCLGSAEFGGVDIAERRLIEAAAQRDPASLRPFE